MKRLVVVRHAEAEKVQIGQTDFDRELTIQGKNDAAEVAGCLLAKRVFPDLIISSPSSRAYRTARILGEVFGLDKKKIARKILLYDEIETGKIVALLKKEARHAETVFLVGHNPVLQRMIQELTGINQQLPIAGAAVIDFDVERWSKIYSTKGELIHFEVP